MGGPLRWQGKAVCSELAIAKESATTTCVGRLKGRQNSGKAA